MLKMVECSYFWVPSFMIQNEDPLLILEILIVQELCDFFIRNVRINSMSPCENNTTQYSWLL
jgi:hypothetical protein